jgi:hypothetical protein
MKTGRRLYDNVFGERHNFVIYVKCTILRKVIYVKCIILRKLVCPHLFFFFSFFFLAFHSRQLIIIKYLKKKTYNN